MRSGISTSEVDETLVTRIAALEARCATLEQLVAQVRTAQEQTRYLGVWKAEQTYRPQNSVTWNGSLWVCLADGAGQPGVDFERWRLAVKRGRDARPGHTPPVT